MKFRRIRSTGTTPRGLSAGDERTRAEISQTGASRCQNAGGTDLMQATGSAQFWLCFAVVGSAKKNYIGGSACQAVMLRGGRAFSILA